MQKTYRTLAFAAGAILLMGGLCGEGPKISPDVKMAAVTPAEGKTGQTLSIRGEALDKSGLVVKLISQPDGQQWSAAIISRRWNSLEFVVPSGIGSRRLFKIKVVDGGTRAAWTVGTKSPYVYLRGSGGGPTGSQAVRVAIIQPEWRFTCTSLGFDCTWPSFHGYAPQYGGKGSWSDPPWDEHKLMLDNAADDWSTICSPAWEAPTPHGYQLKRNFSEAYTREYWTWNSWFWWESTDRYTPTSHEEYWYGSAAVRVFARGAFPDFGGGEVSIGQLFPSSDFRGTLTDGITIAMVGAFMEYGEQNNPNDPETGIGMMAGGSDPMLVDDFSLGGLTGTNTHGMVIVTGSPAKDYFPDPTGGGLSPGGSIWPLIAALEACDMHSCYPAPDGDYDKARTPGGMSHEWWHIFSDSWDPGILEPFCKDTVFVSCASCTRRGFNAYSDVLLRTPYSECRSAFYGNNGLDVTH